MKKTFDKKIIVGIWLLIFAVLTIFDHQISNFLYNPASTFGWFFEVFGEFVISIAGCIGAALLFRFNENSIGKRIGFVLLFIMNALMGTMLVSLQVKLNVIVSGVLLVIFSALMILIAYRVPEHKRDAAKRVAVIGVVLAIVPIMTVNLLKFVWGRPLYRSLANPLVEFTPWYMLKPLAAGNEFMSFPSGHSANSATIIWLTLLPFLFDSFKGKQKPLMIFTIIWTILVMISRIVVGAHYSTDVFIGATITFIIFAMLKSRYSAYLEKE